MAHNTLGMQGPELIRINTSLPIECVQTDRGNWIAVCEPLRITIQAETWAELMEDMADTLDALFHELLNTNELDRFLRDHGWTPATPIPVERGPLRFDVPFIPHIMGVPA